MRRVIVLAAMLGCLIGSVQAQTCSLGGECRLVTPVCGPVGSLPQPLPSISFNPLMPSTGSPVQVLVSFDGQYFPGASTALVELSGTTIRVSQFLQHWGGVPLPNSTCSYDVGSLPANGYHVEYWGSGGTSIPFASLASAELVVIEPQTVPTASTFTLALATLLIALIATGMLPNPALRTSPETQVIYAR